MEINKSDRGLPDTPLGEIALCLSGGGYRATAFHLGAMAYLHHVHLGEVSLLHRVKALSTVSGGTFTGVLYALYTQKGESFPKIYNRIVGMLYQHDLVKEALEKIHFDSWKSPSKKHNLINAFAEIYDELLTKGATFRTLTTKRNTHLDLIAFNTTDLTRGLSFRFQSEWNGNVQYNRLHKGGAGKYRLNSQQLKEVRLADVIAASSCFPGGFEPLAFPDDFIHEASKNLMELKQKPHFSEPLGLMDGGIYDNQGIESITLAEKRRAENLPGKDTRKPFDLLIISDVSSPDILDPFTFHQERDREISSFSIRNIVQRISFFHHLVFGMAVVGILVGIGTVMYQAWTLNFWTGAATVILLFSLLILILLDIVQKKTRSFQMGVRDFVRDKLPKFYQERLKLLELEKYTVKELEPMVVDRIKSLLLIVKDIFLKQVRRLMYDTVFESGIHNYRRAGNLIKKLTPEDWDSQKLKKFRDLKSRPSAFKGSYHKVVGPAIEKVIKRASEFGTTLWFTEDDHLHDTIDCLLAAGQCTMCFTLIEYICLIREAPSYNNYNQKMVKEIEQLLKNMTKDWEKFKDNPKWMVNLVE